MENNVLELIQNIEIASLKSMIAMLKEENKKLKECIDILKDRFDIKFAYKGVNEDFYAIYALGYFYHLKNKEQYELLKEYLNDYKTKY